MNNDRIKSVIAGVAFISTLAISNFSYAETDPVKLKSDMKKLQNEIKIIHQNQEQLELELTRLNQGQLSPSYNTATARKIGHRGRR